MQIKPKIRVTRNIRLSHIVVSHNFKIIQIIHAYDLFETRYSIPYGGLSIKWINYQINYAVS